MDTYNKTNNTLGEQLGEYKNLQDKLASTVKELERVSRLNAAILEAMPMGLAIFNKDFQVVDCNAELCKMFESDKERIASRYFEDFSLPELADGQNAYTKALELMRRTMEGEKVQMEWPHITADGTPLPCDLILTRVQDEEEYVGLGFLYDLRESKRLSRQLEEALTRALSADQAKSEFLSRVSHEMRTPLNIIVGKLQISQMQIARVGQVPGMQENLQSNLEEMSRACVQLLGLIDNIIQASSLEYGTLSLKEAPFDFTALTKKVFEKIGNTAEANKQKFIVSVDETIPQILVGDGERLEQVWMNLLLNALKFTPSRGEIRCLVEILEKSPKAITLQIQVTDSGIGIAKEEQEDLFDLFSQVDGGVARKYGGLGLGLALSKQLVKLMGGDIQLESKPGKGSTFSFTCVLGDMHET